MLENSDFLIYPEFVSCRYSLWEFDKGGTLQDILHLLKYGGYFDLGVELGAILGNMLKTRKVLQVMFRDHEPLLVPVPLHRRRQRFRGYNQAEAIALGVEQSTGWKRIHPTAVERVKDTGSQIGLSIGERRENIRNAFRVHFGQEFENFLPVIIDDVFTTGATTFELAGQLVSEGAQQVAIGTIAQA
ncbi:MAG: ComF family protein [Balneolaceae bacterium]